MRRKACTGSVGCGEGIFYIQGVSHAYLKLLAFPLTRQKKTTVGLEISVIMSVQDIKPFNVSDHSRTYGITHNMEPCWCASYLHTTHFFKRGKVGVDIAIGGKNR